MTKTEIALNIACDLLIGSNLYGYDYDRVFEEIMDKDGVVSANSIKEFILDHVEELGKEYLVEEEKVCRICADGTCKFKSAINCDFCAFHSDCEEHWKEGETNEWND